MNFFEIFVLFFFSLLCYTTEGNRNGSIFKQAISANQRLLQNSTLLQVPASFPEINRTHKLICYYVFTSEFKPDIMSDLCTHINVGFFNINNLNHSLETSSDNLKILSEIMLLKNKNIKIIISVGGSGADGFSSMVSNHTTRKMFIKSSMQFIKKFSLDGIDIDWEWPALNGQPKEKIKFVQLLHELRAEFNRHKKKYILSIDAPANKQIIDLGYYVQYIAEYVDYINIMCYDYHFYTIFYPLTGHNAPLYSLSSNLLSDANINFTVHYWISNLMPREKIVLGIPTYGHTFKLSLSEKHDLNSPASGCGSVGSDGYADHRQICNFLSEKNATIVYDKISKVPYAYEFLEWVSFDNEASVALKASYALEQKLSGVMVFSVNSDDHQGICKGIKLPLIRTIRSILFNKV